jgi:hypothetical protein
VADHLCFVWGRADAVEPVYSADEVALWPQGALDQLSACGLLRPTANAKAVVCDACGRDHVEEVTLLESPPGSGLRAYICCPDAGRASVPLDRLRQREIDFRQLARTIASALATAGEVEELVPSRVWLLSKTMLAGRPHEVFLARGLPWSDGAEVVGKARRLLASSRPVVLVPGSVPPQGVWRGDAPPVLPLSALLSCDDTGPAIDRALLEAAVVKGGATKSPAPPDPNPPDGPEGGCWLWWQEKRHDVPKGTVYRLLAYMWDRDSASYEDLDGPVLDGDVLPQSIRSLTSKTNKVLRKVGVPWRLTADFHRALAVTPRAGGCGVLAAARTLL